jgi:hypothetical protein
MGRERHLQLHFADPGLQSVSSEYGFDGAVVDQPGDFLLLTDTSVNSTKLNLILKDDIAAHIRLDSGGAATTTVDYTIVNPFPEWQQGRDPALVEALMLQGRYGAYLRLYASPGAEFLDLRVNSQSAGPEEIGDESGKRLFSRYASVPPGETTTVQFQYRTAAIVEPIEDGWYVYRLYVQKQAGTRATPLTLDLEPPDGARVRSVTLDGVEADTTIHTDLRVDRTVEVVFRPRK